MDSARVPARRWLFAGCLPLVAALCLSGCASHRESPDATRKGVPPAPGSSTGQVSVAPSGSANERVQTARSGAVGSVTPGPNGWQSLFDGKTLSGWKVTEFGGHGEVRVKNGLLLIQMGVMLTGVSWTNPLPKTDYELELDAMKVDGGDFFCGLTFPVRDSFCSLIVGGWGGGVVGLSSIDGQDASENETTKFMSFDKNRWYPIRLRVTQAKIEVWIENEKLVDQSIVDRRISLRPGEIELSAPFGLATWQTTAALRNLRIRNISAARPEPK